MDSKLTDEVLLQELGRRLAEVRIEANITQAELAERSGVSKRTVERLETGAVASQLSVFLRVCRALGLLEQLERFLPEPKPSPMAQLKRQGKPRRRASGKKASNNEPWTWKESS